MKDKIKYNYKYYILQTFFLMFVEVFNQILLMNSLENNLKQFFTAMIFDVIWYVIIMTFLSFFSAKLKKMITLIFDVLVIVINSANYFEYMYFGSAFSWKDIILSSDGASFISSVFKYININYILYLLISIILVFTLSKVKIKEFKKSYFNLVLIIILVYVNRLNFINLELKNSRSEAWNGTEVKGDSALYYNNWIDTARLLRICGTYEYLVKDFSNTFISKDVSDFSINEYILGHKESDKNKHYKGLFKEKNLIFVMLESIDMEVINEKSTPTMYMMMKHGFNFVNHHSPTYVTGSTANTEFIVNTGLYPKINGLNPNYAYARNSFPYSIANQFKKEGYIVNSFHRSNGDIYNREQMHKSLGYNEYFDYSMMGINVKNIDLDRYLVLDGYEKFVKNDKFMSFIITYSGHSPYIKDKIECNTNFDYIKNQFKDENSEEKLCKYSEAYETDTMFNLLIEKLENDNKLKDTIIIAFTDHLSTGEIVKDKVKDNTAFFIYDSSMSENIIDIVSSSIDIVPTILNLFGIDNEYTYPGNDLLNVKQNYVIFSDYTYFDGFNLKKIDSNMRNDLKYSEYILNNNYFKK